MSWTAEAADLSTPSSFRWPRAAIDDLDGGATAEMTSPPSMRLTTARFLGHEANAANSLTHASSPPSTSLSQMPFSNRMTSRNGDDKRNG